MSAASLKNIHYKKVNRLFEIWLFQKDAAYPFFLSRAKSLIQQLVSISVGNSKTGNFQKGSNITS